MKCNARIFRYASGRKAFAIAPTEDLSAYKRTRQKVDWDNPEICDGNVRVSIGAYTDQWDDESCYASANIICHCQCDKCGLVHINDKLPTEYTLENWINTILDKME